MAFYLAQGNQKQIFEDLQAWVPLPFSVISTRFSNHQHRNLEKAVEDLSQLLEEPIEADTVKDLRKRMMDKTVRFRCITEIIRRCHPFAGLRAEATRDSAERHRSPAGRGEVGMDNTTRRVVVVSTCTAIHIWANSTSDFRDHTKASTVLRQLPEPGRWAFNVE